MRRLLAFSAVLASWLASASALADVDLGEADARGLAETLPGEPYPCPGSQCGFSRPDPPLEPTLSASSEPPKSKAASGPPTRLTRAMMEDPLGLYDEDGRRTCWGGHVYRTSAEDVVARATDAPLAIWTRAGDRAWLARDGVSLEHVARRIRSDWPDSPEGPRLLAMSLTLKQKHGAARGYLARARRYGLDETRARFWDASLARPESAGDLARKWGPGASLFAGALLLLGVVAWLPRRRHGRAAGEVVR